MVKPDFVPSVSAGPCSSSQCWSVLSQRATGEHNDDDDVDDDKDDDDKNHDDAADENLVVAIEASGEGGAADEGEEGEAAPGRHLRWGLDDRGGDKDLDDDSHGHDHDDSHDDVMMRHGVHFKEGSVIFEEMLRMIR